MAEHTDAVSPRKYWLQVVLVQEMKPRVTGRYILLAVDMERNADHRICTYEDCDHLIESLRRIELLKEGQLQEFQNTITPDNAYPFKEVLLAERELRMLGLQPFK